MSIAIHKYIDGTEFTATTEHVSDAYRILAADYEGEDKIFADNILKQLADLDCGDRKRVESRTCWAVKADEERGN